MNGVHCQISSISIDSLGWVVRNEMFCAFLTPSSPSSPSTRPKPVCSMPLPQKTAAAMGTIRNGAIIIVRTTPRPKNLRSSSRATPSAEQHRDHHDGHGHLDRGEHRVAVLRGGEDLS